jgi:hypothetical protein
MDDWKADAYPLVAAESERRLQSTVKTSTVKSSSSSSGAGWSDSDVDAEKLLFTWCSGSCFHHDGPAQEGDSKEGDSKEGDEQGESIADFCCCSMVVGDDAEEQEEQQQGEQEKKDAPMLTIPCWLLGRLNELDLIDRSTLAGFAAGLAYTGASISSVWKRAEEQRFAPLDELIVLLHVPAAQDGEQPSKVPTTGATRNACRLLVRIAEVVMGGGGSWEDPIAHKVAETADGAERWKEGSEDEADEQDEQDEQEGKEQEEENDGDMIASLEDRWRWRREMQHTKVSQLRMAICAVWCRLLEIGDVHDQEHYDVDEISASFLLLVEVARTVGSLWVVPAGHPPNKAAEAVGMGALVEAQVIAGLELLLSTSPAGVASLAGAATSMNNLRCAVAAVELATSARPANAAIGGPESGLRARLAMSVLMATGRFAAKLQGQWEGQGQEKANSAQRQAQTLQRFADKALAHYFQGRPQLLNPAWRATHSTAGMVLSPVLPFAQAIAAGAGPDRDGTASASIAGGWERITNLATSLARDLVPAKVLLVDSLTTLAEAVERLKHSIGLSATDAKETTEAVCAKIVGIDW